MVRLKKDPVRLGSGSACPGERLEPAVELVESGDIDYIVFDSLSESEILAFERHKLSHPDQGYDLYTERRLTAILPGCVRNDIKIIGNMGGANPKACQDLAIAVSRDLGLYGLKIAAVVGDNVLETVKLLDPITNETGQRISTFGNDLVSAYAYIPSTSIVEALHADGVGDDETVVAEFAPEKVGEDCGRRRCHVRGNMGGRLSTCLLPRRSRRRPGS